MSFSQNYVREKQNELCIRQFCYVMYTQKHTINLDYVLCAYVHSGYCKIQPGFAHTDTYNKLGLCIMCLC